jgi:hypothetical protein
MVHAKKIGDASAAQGKIKSVLGAAQEKKAPQCSGHVRSVFCKRNKKKTMIHIIVTNVLGLSRQHACSLGGGYERSSYSGRWMADRAQEWTHESSIIYRTMSSKRYQRR